MTRGTIGGVSERDDDPHDPPRLPRAALYGSIGAVWALALVFAVLIGTISGSVGFASWLSLALGACVLGALVAQLATQQKDGFVNRFAASVTGAFVVLVVAGAILTLVVASH